MSANTSNDFIIDFMHASDSEQVLSYHLDEEFFVAQEGEIQSGDVDLKLYITPLPGDHLFDLRFIYEGTVIVECDRCLAPLELDMDVEESLNVKLGEELDDEDDQNLTLDAKDPQYDFSHIIYELLALHLPLQRMHDIEDCDPIVRKYLVGDEPTEPAAEQDIKSEENPIWAKLRNEIENKNTNN